MSGSRLPGVLLLCALLLAGCESMPPTRAGETAAFKERVPGLQSVREWQVSGRIAFRYQGDGGTGAMTWLQRDDYMAFSFRGPLGAASFNVTGSPPALLLETGEGDRQMLSDPETELRARFGWSAPFDSLRYWMLGAPHPAGKAEIQVDDSGLLRELRQDGWLITYDRYHPDEPRLPRKLTIQREDVRIRVIVDFWRLTGSASPGGEEPRDGR